MVKRGNDKLPAFNGTAIPVSPRSINWLCRLECRAERINARLLVLIVIVKHEAACRHSTAEALYILLIPLPGCRLLGLAGTCLCLVGDLTLCGMTQGL